MLYGLPMITNPRGRDAMFSILGVGSKALQGCKQRPLSEINLPILLLGVLWPFVSLLSHYRHRLT
jgi:hypothetical protein